MHVYKMIGCDPPYLRLLRAIFRELILERRDYPHVCGNVEQVFMLHRDHCLPCIKKQNKQVFNVRVEYSRKLRLIASLFQLKKSEEILLV